MVSRRQLLAAGLLVVAGSYLFAGGLSPSTSAPATDEPLNRSNLIQPTPDGSYLWPYTSRRRATGGRTLAINLVIHGADARVKRALTEQTSLEWELATEPVEPRPRNDSLRERLNDSFPGFDWTGLVGPNASAENRTENASNRSVANGENERERGVIDEGIISWSDAHGSTRYSYIDTRPRGGTARWLDESYQFHAGSYFGSRQHIRAYTLPRATWTAVQVHEEYWDWFRMRHTVTSTQSARNALEADFLDQPYVTDVRRTYYGVDRGWNDGWISEIELAPGLFGVVLLFGVLSRGTRRSLVQEGRTLVGWLRDHVRGLVLGTVVAGLYLSVRAAGVALETAFPALDPRAFLPVLYPLVALGLPIVTAVLAHPFRPSRRFERLHRLAERLGQPLSPLAAFSFAAAGLGGAFVLDFGGLGVSAIPVELALHRIGLAVALGLVAAGAIRLDERGGGLLLVGTVGWLAGLLLPLLGYL